MSEGIKILKVVKDIFSGEDFKFSQIIKTTFFYDKNYITIYDMRTIIKLNKTKSLNIAEKCREDLVKLDPEKTVVAERFGIYVLDSEKELTEKLDILNSGLLALLNLEETSKYPNSLSKEHLKIHKEILQTLKIHLMMIYTQDARVAIDNYYGDLTYIFSRLMRVYLGFILRNYYPLAKDKLVFLSDLIKYINFYTKDYNLEYDERLMILKNDTVKIIKIGSISDFTSELTKINNSNLYYRGHSKINYSLIPSLFRSYQFFEYSMIQDLMLSIPNDFGKEKNHFEMLLKMQHYELPTRLLDITTNPLVALFFACLNDEYHGEVKLINPENDQICYPNSDRVRMLSGFAFLKQDKKWDLISKIRNNTQMLKSLKEEDQQPLIHEIRTYFPSFEPRMLVKDMIKPLIIKSPKSNPRIAAQSGSFIISPMDQFQRKELAIKTLLEDEKHTIFIVDKNRKKFILNQLSKLNINKGTMFPEIAEKAKNIKDLYS